MLDLAEPAYKTKRTVDRTEMSRSLSLDSYVPPQNDHDVPHNMSMRPAISPVSTGLSRRDGIAWREPGLPPAGEATMKEKSGDRVHDGSR